MSASVDLHMHSTASDGVLEPAELVRKVAEAGIGLFALTDHDTTAGVSSAAAAARALGLKFLAGVEISVSWGSQTVHVVGLDLDTGCSGLQQGLAELQAYRIGRAEEIDRRLAVQGIQGALVAAREYAGSDLVGRTHFARFLVEQGHAPDMKKVFRRFLTRGKPGYVPGKWAELGQALGWIHAAGGVAVLAHPARYSLNRNRMRRLLGEFAEAGGEALEVVSNSHSRDEIHVMDRLAEEFGLEGSVGSDFHDPAIPWAQLGREMILPGRVPPVWQRWML